ncbi:Hypothetical protein POVR1_LOCUS346 [uncultured virus]|nr:Hypothetical protein POVR1_LOCUS346 [uncultured virus]
MFEVKPLNRSSLTNGLGAFSTQKIPGGTKVFTEPPITTVPISDHMMWQLTKDLLIAGHGESIKTLASIPVSKAPPITKKMLKELLPKFSKSIVERTYHIVCRNAYVIRNFLTYHQRGLGLYPVISRFNHHCNPNCALVFDDVSGMIVAIRDIDVDEELTLSYHLLASSALPVLFRQKIIVHHYDFICQCSECEKSIASSCDDISTFEVLERSPLDERLIKLCKVLIEKELSPNITMVIAVLCLRSFLSSGQETDHAIFCNDLAVQCLELIHHVKESYLRWYAEWLLTLILEIDHPTHFYQESLLVNDRKDCSALNVQH